MYRVDCGALNLKGLNTIHQKNKKNNYTKDKIIR